MNGLFDNPGAFAPFEETVKCEFALASDASGVVREFPLRAALLESSSLTPGAGATVASETGDKMSVLVRKSSWPMEEDPAPGTRIIPEDRGTWTCKSVQPLESGWALVCTRNQRGGGAL